MSEGEVTRSEEGTTTMMMEEVVDGGDEQARDVAGLGRQHVDSYSSVTTGIAQMNDAAVALLLERQDCKAASALLNEAVSLMIETRRQQNLQLGQQEQPYLGARVYCRTDAYTEPRSNCSAQHSNFEDIVMGEPHPDSSPFAQSSDEVLRVSPSPLTPEGGDSSTAFYSRPFVFRHHLGPHNRDQRKSIETCFAGGIAVCIYNLAICKHREWKTGIEPLSCSEPPPRRENESDRVMAQVISLYQKALNILLSLKPSLSGSMTILIAALCHNLSSIYFEKGDLKQVKTWKQVLTQALAFVDTNRLDQESYQFFLMSTALSGVDTVAAGAA